MFSLLQSNGICNAFLLPCKPELSDEACGSTQPICNFACPRNVVLCASPRPFESCLAASVSLDFPLPFTCKLTSADSSLYPLLAKLPLAFACLFYSFFLALSMFSWLKCEGSEEEGSRASWKAGEPRTGKSCCLCCLLMELLLLRVSLVLPLLTIFVAAFWWARTMCCKQQAPPCPFQTSPLPTSSHFPRSFFYMGSIYSLQMYSIS